VPRAKNAHQPCARCAKAALERNRGVLLVDEPGDGESDEGQDRTRSNEAFELEHGASRA
jgi:hypothetical protein